MRFRLVLFVMFSLSCLFSVIFVLLLLCSTVCFLAIACLFIFILHSPFVCFDVFAFTGAFACLYLFVLIYFIASERFLCYYFSDCFIYVF